MSCYFCREGRNFAIAKERLGLSWPFENEVVYYDDNIFAIVGSSPQVVPYLLILPYRHIYSASEMSSDEMTSFLKCMNYLCGRGGFGEDLCFFEHGGKSEEGSSSIDHCHIHIIDAKYDLFNQKRFDGFTKYSNTIPCITESYLMVGTYSKKGFEVKVANDSLAHERQYFRRRLAEILGENEWDWRKDPRQDRMLETMKGFNLLQDS